MDVSPRATFTDSRNLEKSEQKEEGHRRYDTQAALTLKRQTAP
jgi:hypothetical protein